MGSVKVATQLKVACIYEMFVWCLQRLCEKRATGGRPDKLEDLDADQLLEEKVAMQKALLHFESLFGRPASKEDRDLARPLYDKYRNIKRMVARANMVK